MMGGVDTAMPNKVVRRAVEEMLHEADVKMPMRGDVELVHTIDRVASVTGHRPIEICWMTWLIQPEGAEGEGPALPEVREAHHAQGVRGGRAQVPPLLREALPQAQEACGQNRECGVRADGTSG